MLKMFKLNHNISYPVGPQFSSVPRDMNIIDVHVNEKDSFRVTFDDIIKFYKLDKVNTLAILNRWTNEPMKFWQNQLNFAIWCATAGCGVPINVQSDSKLGNSFYKFHVYYCVRRILRELIVPLPNEDEWDAVDNIIDKAKYEQICEEFGVDVNYPWHINGPNKGLGNNYFKTITGKEVPVYLKSLREGFNQEHQSYTKPNRGAYLHIDYTEQEKDVNPFGFMLDYSKGFTKAGIPRINDSIRTFVWAILAAQAQARTDIIGVGTAYDAQKQFKQNIIAAIDRPVDIPESINRYENTLKYASTPVNFSFGANLYMSPSDMRLKIEQHEGYNNNIVISSTPNVGIQAEFNTKPTHFQHNSTGFQHNSTVNKHNSTENEHNSTENEHNSTENEHNSTGLQHNSTDFQHNSTEIEHNSRENEHNSTNLTNWLLLISTAISVILLVKT
jgi:hypothetical protein